MTRAPATFPDEPEPERIVTVPTVYGGTLTTSTTVGATTATIRFTWTWPR